jgi:hypothetical protein
LNCIITIFRRTKKRKKTKFSSSFFFQQQQKEEPPPKSKKSRNEEEKLLDQPVHGIRAIEVKFFKNNTFATIGGKIIGFTFCDKLINQPFNNQILFFCS